MILCLMSFFTVGCQNNILKYDKNTQQEIYGKLKSAIKFQFDDPESVKFYDVRKIQNDIVVNLKKMFQEVFIVRKSALFTMKTGRHFLLSQMKSLMKKKRIYFTALCGKVDVKKIILNS